MEVIQWCKSQLICLLILAYVGIDYIKEGKQLNRLTKKSNCNTIYDMLFIVTEVAVVFDAITAFTVNYLQQIPRGINLFFHACMFVSYEIYVVLLFWYWVSVTIGIPKKKWIKAVTIVPLIAIIGLTLVLLPDISFIEGKYTNYSMGAAVYVCFGSVIFYCILSLAIVFSKYRYISKHKRNSLSTSLFCIVVIVIIQVAFPESLITCIAATIVTISIYLTMENPDICGLEHYQNEMVMGFATLVENKDDNTGGHIRRSSAYAVLIAKNLRRNPKYSNVITKDFIDDLILASPMHDVGKIGIPDAILQKPGKLTNEEFEKMKEHPVIGGKIVRDTFGHLFDGEYENMAYQVAMYHHEKWNGKGYPQGLSGTQIPLCARIMAVADVFDAVSAKRCYRDAMPLEQCYDIIKNGRGTDFDPDVVDAFFYDRDMIEDIYHK